MKTINKVQLLGNTGRDPEVRYTQSGTAIASFSLATASRKKNQSGEYTDVTQWHNCVAFGKLAEIVGQYVVKGTKLYVDGAIEYQEWDDQGVKKKATKIIVNELVMLSGSDGGKSEPVKHEQVDQQFDDDSIPF